MEGKIAIEEHFAYEASIAGSEFFHGAATTWPVLKRQLIDLHQERIEQMDRLGIEWQVLSLNSPGIQAMTNAKEAVELSRRMNDYLAEQVARRPSRFAALAALPLLDVDAAARELTRCVKELGFVGALVNGYSHREGVADSAVYYDLPQFGPFWAELERLDVPFYLHPRDPLPSQQLIYSGHPWLLTAAWGFGVETATHALRLICSGLFDKYPKLKIVIGHLGEGLPYLLWRLDRRIALDRRGIAIKRTPSEYFRSHFYITTSANFHTLSLIDAMLEVGSDRILFAVDYPFDKMEDAAEWFDNATISENDRLKIGRLNSLKLFKLPVSESAISPSVKKHSA